MEIFTTSIYKGRRRTAPERRAEEQKDAETHMVIETAEEEENPPGAPKAKRQRKGKGRGLLSREEVEYNLRTGVSAVTEYGSGPMSIIDKTRADRGF